MYKQKTDSSPSTKIQRAQEEEKLCKQQLKKKV